MRELLIVLAVLIGFFGITALLPTCWFKFFRHNTPLSGSERQLVLSFDDGPDSRYTEQLLELLAQYQVKAVFFVLAEKAAKHPKLLCRMLAEGHQVGLHGLRHRSAFFYPYKQCKADLRGSLLFLEELGCEPVYYRPPHGYVNLGLLYLIRSLGLKLFLWTVMAQDWRADATPEGILTKLCQRCRPGSVICLHDSGEGTGGAPGAPARTIAALQQFLPEMLDQGYRFVLPQAER